MILRDYVAPRVLDHDFASAADVAARTAHIRGHLMARGGLEVGGLGPGGAMRNGSPLYRADRRRSSTEIPCGVSIGIQDSVEQLIDKIETELAAGYQRIKMKIKPGWDIDVVSEVRRAVSGHPADGRRQLRLHARRRGRGSKASTNSI